MNDQAIIEMFFARREDAIAAIGDKYGGAALRIAQNILHNREDAEECVNDAYLTVWNNIPPARPVCLAAYLFKIARNVALKRYRGNVAAKRNGHFNVSLEEISEIVPDGESVDDRIEKEELRKDLNDFLRALNEADRYVFLRKYWYMDDVAEIAQAAGLTESAVYKRLEKIKKQLYDHLAARQVFEGKEKP